MYKPDLSGPSLKQHIAYAKSLYSEDNITVL